MVRLGGIGGSCFVGLRESCGMGGALGVYYKVFVKGDVMLCFTPMWNSTRLDTAWLGCMV